MNQKVHSHYCPSCDRNVDCVTAREGGCIFSTSTEMTCGICAARACGHEDPESFEHLCQCAAPDPPVNGARCGTCCRYVSMEYPDDRVIDLTRLGLETK